MDNKTTSSHFYTCTSIRHEFQQGHHILFQYPHPRKTIVVTWLLIVCFWFNFSHRLLRNITRLQYKRPYETWHCSWPERLCYVMSIFYWRYWLDGMFYVSLMQFNWYRFHQWTKLSYIHEYIFLSKNNDLCCHFIIFDIKDPSTCCLMKALQIFEEDT